MLLPYCVALHSAEIKDFPGIRGAPVEQLAEDNLQCYYSRYEAFANPNSEDGLRFYETVSKIFASGAVIQFRFPMLLNSEPELREHVAQNAKEYADFLRETQDLVQMDVQFTSTALQPQAGSGVEYLRARSALYQQLEAAADALRNAVGGIATDWRNSSAQSGKLLAYALVKRADLGNFRERLRSIAIAPEIKMSVTGPWPAMQFFEAESAT